MGMGKILIIDDDQVMAGGISKRLAKRGYDVEVRNSGEGVLEKLAEETYDLIMLDIKMPILSGIEVLEGIRRIYKKNLLPIIMFSSCDEDEDIINALKLGANDYVTKPVNIDVLLSRIQTQLELKSLSLDFAMKEQLGAVTAMITTYNHEINNALAISMGHLSGIKHKGYLPEVDFNKVYDSQLRIHDVVKKINDVAEANKINFTNYGKNSKMIKID